LAGEVKRNYLITDFLEYKELSKACNDRPDYERLIKEAAEKEIGLELTRIEERFYWDELLHHLHTSQSGQATLGS